MPIPRIALNVFELSNSESIFAPLLYPDVTISKSRNKNRTDNLCDGETVEDTGSKNREILVRGRIMWSELSAFDALLDVGEPMDMLADEWVGEVEVVDGEFTPVAKDQLRYTLNLVSTGRDEGTYVPDGIITRGTNFIASGRLDGLAQGDGI